MWATPISQCKIKIRDEAKPKTPWEFGEKADDDEANDDAMFEDTVDRENRAESQAGGDPTEATQQQQLHGQRIRQRPAKAAAPKTMAKAPWDRVHQRPNRYSMTDDSSSGDHMPPAKTMRGTGGEKSRR